MSQSVENAFRKFLCPDPDTDVDFQNVFSCTAARVFNKLTYLLTYLRYGLAIQKLRFDSQLYSVSQIL